MELIILRRFNMENLTWIQFLNKTKFTHVFNISDSGGFNAVLVTLSVL